MLNLTNKQFALIGIFVIATLQLIAYGIGFDGQFTILCTGILTFLFGIVTGSEVKKVEVNNLNQAIQNIMNEFNQKENK